MAIKYLSDIFIFVIEYYYWFNNTQAFDRGNYLMIFMACFTFSNNSLDGINLLVSV